MDPFVSALVQACEEYGEGQIGNSEFIRFLEFSRPDIDALLASARSYGLTQSAAAFQAILQRLVDAMHSKDEAAIRVEMTYLRDAACGLEAGTQDEEEGSLLNFVHDRGLGGAFSSSLGLLPRNFRRLMKLGTSFQEGECSRDDLLQAIAQLEMTVRQARKSLEHGAPKTPPEAVCYLEPMRKGFAVTLDALESLRALADHGDARALAAAQASFNEADDLLRIVKDAPDP